MTDCGAVHDWIDDHHFRSFHEVVDYVRVFDKRWSQTHGNLNAQVWGAMWDCVDEYDFETELLLVNVTIHKRKTGQSYRQLQLRRRDRERKVFVAVGLDANTRLAVKNLIQQGF